LYAFILAQLTSDDPRLVGLILISVTEEFLIGSHYKLGRNYTQYKIPRIAKTECSLYTTWHIEHGFKSKFLVPGFVLTFNDNSKCFLLSESDIYNVLAAP